MLSLNPVPSRTISPVETGSEVELSQGSKLSLVRSLGSKVSSVHCHNSSSIIVKALLQGDADESLEVDRYRRICGCWWTSKMRLLFVTAISCSVITGAQTVGAIIANSDALMADCVAGGVNSFAYFLNIFVEASKGKRGHCAAELFVPAASIVFLVVFTNMVLWASIATLQGSEDVENDHAEEVNPWIVLGFALWGLVHNIVCLFALRRDLQRSGGKVGVNILGVLLTLGANLLRGLVKLIEAVLIIAFGFNTVVTDAWACVFVSGMIILGAVYAILEWTMDAYEGCFGVQIADTA